MRAVCSFLVAVLCLPALAWAQVDLSRPLEADQHTLCLFHLDDVAGGEVEDAAGGPGGVVNEALPSFGRFGGAMSCDAARGWADVAEPRNAPDRQGLTVECWAKFRTRATGDIICRNHEYMMRISGTVQAYLGIDGQWRQVHGARAVPVGSWTHLAITYDQRSKQARIYVDGRLDVAQVPQGITDGRLNVGDTRLRIGSNTWEPARAVPDGKLDEVRISSVAREFEPLHPLAEHQVPEGTNLVANPSFEFGMHAWRANHEANALLQWRLETGDAPHGRAFLRSTEERGYSIITHPMTIARGKVHTVSATMRADAPCKGKLTLRCTGVGRKVSRPGKSHSFDVAEQWQPFSAQIEVPADWPTSSAYLGVAKPQGVTLDVDAVSLSGGERAEYTQSQAQSVGIIADLPPQSTYLLGTQASLPLEVVNLGERDRQLTLACEITDWLGRSVQERVLEVGIVSAGVAAHGQIEIPTDRIGWFAASFTIREGEKTLKQTTRLFNVIEPMKGVGDLMASPLGMNTHMEREPTPHLDCNLGMLSLCGVKWIRAWWGWGMAEKQPGQFDWSEYDRQLDAVHRAGMEIMPILLRYYPGYEHDWAGKTERIQQPPYDLDQWATFVETTVRRYRGRVKAWEVWNEPTFTMEPEYYAELLKVTYERIKAADPEALVVGFGGVGLDFIRKVFEAGSAPYLDVLSHHTYSRLSRPFEQMADMAADTETLVKEFGATERVWHSEQGTGADGIGYIALGQSEEGCAVNLVQAYLSALATGVEKFFWFSAQTSPAYGWAVFRENYVPRPRLVALNGLARLLDGRQVTGRMELGDGQVACMLLDGEAGAAAALWCPRELVSVTLPGGKAITTADMLANPMALTGAAGKLAVDLAPGRPVYLIAAAMSAEQLAGLLREATLTQEFPARASAHRTEGGKLEVTIENLVDHSLDLRASVRAPELFAAVPAAVTILDLPGRQTHSITLTPDKRADGAQVEVSIVIEMGEHGVREHSGRLQVAF